MNITLKISLKDNLIIADAPETAFHVEFANVILMEKTQNKLMGMGVSLEEAERTAPKEFAAQKQNLVTWPAFSSVDFQVNITYVVIRYLAAAACLHNRNIFFVSLFGKGNLSCSLSLPGYEQIPRALRDQFEYQLLANPITGTKRNVAQLIINSQTITEPNQEIVKKEKKYQLQQRISNLLIGTFIGFLLISFLLILLVVPLAIFQSTLGSGQIGNKLVTGIGAFVLAVAGLVLAAYLSEMLGTFGGLAILRCFLPGKTVANLAEKRNYSTKSIKRLVDKFFTEQQ